ncbi:MAG: GDSL-type esterase/lipase family protein [Victivallales bacterium]
MKRISIRKKIIYAILTISGSTLLCLLAAEIVIRIFFPQQDSMRWFVSDPDYGYLNRKSFSQDYVYSKTGFLMRVRTNSLGHRGPEPDKAILGDKDATRILLIGDSFTFGYGVENEDHFGTLLEQKLRDKGRKCTVLNSGVAGWGSLQALNYARDHFEQFRPDIVIYTFCGNDADDDIRFTSDKSLTDREKGLFYFPGKIFIRDHSHLYRLIVEKFRISIHAFALKRKIRKSGDSDVKVDTQSASLVIDDQWTGIAKNIRKFSDDFLKFNPKGIFIVEASSPWDENIREHLALTADGKGIFYLDVYEDTVKIPDTERTMPHDGHWSPKVHAIFADKLAELIGGNL